MNTATCEHLDNTSTSVTPGEPVSAWECDNCGHLTPFTAEDYAFHADLWTPPAPERMNQMEWLFMSPESRFAAYAD